MMRTAKKAFAIAALGVAVAFSATSANAAQTINITEYIDNQGGAKDGTGGEKGVSNFVIDGIFMSAEGLSHTINQGAVSAPAGWTAYHDHGGAGMGVCQGVNGQNQCSDAADDNTQPGPTAGTGEVLKLALNNVGPNYRIDELYFKNDGHTSNFAAGKTVGLSESGAAGSWTDLALANGVADGPGVIGATLTLPAGGIVITAGEALYLAFTNQQFYLAGFKFTVLNNELNPVPLPAGLLLLLSGLMGLGFLGRFRQKTA